MESIQSDFSFHPAIQAWFAQRFPEATDVQRRVWPAVAAGENLVITAPTGSGKTLSAFLYALDRLLSGVWSTGQVRVLYVSPLKALNSDIARNLIKPLAEIREVARGMGISLPEVQVFTRSGDTPERERRAMARQPPEILITTPESLSLLLTSDRGRAMLRGLESVILDEIHAVASNKRGSYLMSAVERLVLLSGEFQRIALSATVRPLDRVCAFVGGYEELRGRYTPRTVRAISSADSKRFEVSVRCPEQIEERLVEGQRYPAIVSDVAELTRKNRSTLIFANNRKMTEKIARMLNEGGEPQAYAHHGSLSREVRQLVENRFKEGELSAIVATSSLELGIDIGDLDQVVLIDPSPSLASGIQRIGRAGHGVGGVARGVIFPTTPHRFVAAAAMAPEMARLSVEELRPIENPLDVLAQLLTAMVAVEDWQVDALYDFLRCIWAYRHLRRDDFDRVLAMLEGRYAETRIRELSARVRRDPIRSTLSAGKGARLLIYRAGGVIPDRGYYNIRHADSNALIGQLDEEFVWERRNGDTFAFGSQTWRVQKITHNDIFVSPSGRAQMLPFWRGEAIDRDFTLCEKIGELLQWADKAVGTEGFIETLENDYCLDRPAAEQLEQHLSRQKEITKAELPHRYHLLIEHFDDPANLADAKRVFLHAQWGARILRPLSICLSAAWEEVYGSSLEVMANDDGIAVNLPAEFTVSQFLALVSPEAIEDLLRRRLEATGFFGARFRENAARALLLPRQKLGKRMPLWLNRLRARKLMESVTRFPEFPIMVETWRGCLQDSFDIVGLKDRLQEVESGIIRTTEIRTSRPSPFSGELLWRATDQYMYEDDSNRGRGPSKVEGRLIDQLIQHSNIRPRISVGLVQELVQKLQRTADGYAPNDEDDLVDLVADRLLIPEPEWQTLLDAMHRDGAELNLSSPTLLERLFRWTRKGQGEALIIDLTNVERQMSVDALSELMQLNGEPLTRTQREHLTKAISAERKEEDKGTGEDLAARFGQFLQFYGPLPADFAGRVFGLDEGAQSEVLQELSDDGLIIFDALLENDDGLQICDMQNLERLLRMKRAASRQTLPIRPLAELMPFLASRHGLTSGTEGLEGLQERLEPLLGFPLPAGLWESDILAARMRPYYTSWLDSLLQQSELMWMGVGPERVAFSFRDWIDLLLDADRPEGVLAGFFSDPLARYGKLELSVRCEKDSGKFGELLWNDVWGSRMSCDSFVPLRNGVLSKFAETKSGQRGQGRRRRPVWNRSVAGSWGLLPETAERDLLEVEEANRDRIRMLFDRYGILFRQRLVHELPGMQWRALWKSLRLMEFSGEAIAGHFFADIPGPQFVDQRSLRELRKFRVDDAVFWINAMDPVSFCGLGLESTRGSLPSRIPSNHLVYCGTTLAVVSRRNGKSLDLRLPPDDSRLPRAFGLFKDLLGRQFRAMSRVEVEQVNGMPVLECDFVKAMLAFGFEKDASRLVLHRRY